MHPELEIRLQEVDLKSLCTISSPNQCLNHYLHRGLSNLEETLRDNITNITDVGNQEQSVEKRLKPESILMAGIQIRASAVSELGSSCHFWVSG